MAYNKKTWISNEIISKDALNNIENGIEAVEQSIPKKTSQLENDSGYITEHQDLSNYAKKDELHEHKNKDVLDGINLVRLQAWDNAANGNNINLEDYATKEEIFSKINTQNGIVSIEEFGIQEGYDVDVEENTKRFQEMIDYCKNEKVICFPAGNFVFKGLDLGEENNITIKGVSSPFASFAQKNIYTGEIKNNFTRIICDMDPGETFFNHKSCVLILEDISFYNLEKNDDGTFSEKESKKNILMQHTKSEDAEENIEKGKAFCFNCGFFGWKVVFGSDFTMQHLENALGTQKVEEEYEYFKQSCVLASKCRFTRNGVAINQPVDGRIIDCSFNKNDYAIILREDSGFTTISNCRIEWNNFNGIYCEKAHEVTVSNCEFDCNGLAGLYAVENTCSNFNGIFRRSGAQVPSQDDESHKEDYINNVHIYAKGNIDCNFIGSNTNVKPISDVGSAPERPSNVSCFENNTNCIIASNNLRGCTKSDKVEANKFLNNINCVIASNMLNEAEEHDTMHEHNNKDILDEIDSVRIQAWDNALQQDDLDDYAKKDELHEHNNKDVLDGINSARLQVWDNALQQDDLNDYITSDEVSDIINNLSTSTLNDSSEIHFLHPASDKAGDCSVIKTCENKWIMIDTGEDGGFAYTKEQLDRLGCTELEILFTTHPHSDHIGEATNIINTYKPKKVYYKNFDWSQLPDYELTDWKSQEYHDKMIQAAQSIGAELIEATDTTISISPCENIKIFASTFYDYSALNHCSLMYLYNFRNTKVLFAGDGTYETEKHVKGQIGPVDIMKIAHHGASTGTGLEFLAELQPKVCLTGGIKGLDSGGSQASLVAKRCKFYLGKVYDMWEVNKSGSIKIFNGTYTHSLIESKFHSSWYRVEEGHANAGKYVYFKSNGDIASNEFISDKLNMHYIEDWYMAAGWFKVDDIDYYADLSTGEIYRNKWLHHTDDNWYYLKLNGVMAKNETLNIDGKQYQFDINGVCENPQE